MAVRRASELWRDVKKGGMLWVPFIPLILLALVFEIIPVLYIIYNSFNSTHGLGLASYREIVQSRYYLVALKNSLLVSLGAAFIGILIGTLGALALKSLGEFWRERLLTLVNMTTNFSGVPLAFAYIVLLGMNGLITVLLKERLGADLYGMGFDLFSWTGIVLVYVYFSVPLAFMLMYPAVYGLRQDIREAAAILGASPRQYWLKIGIPALLPAALGSFTLLFANALGAYATAYALTSSNNTLIAITIANLVSGDIFPDPSLASALAVVMAVLLILSIGINQKLKQRAGGMGR